jgi:DNA-binding beta-propeller fold protein YncE
VIWRQADPERPFDTPVGITAGPGGEVLVTDSALGEVFRLTADGQPAGAFGHGYLTRPTGIARDPVSGLVYVADSAAHDIKVFDGLGRLVETYGSRGERVGEFNGPTHLAFAGGRLYVADTLNARIQVLDAATGGIRRTFGERGLLVGNLVRPKGISVDDEGNIYIIESMHDHLLVYDAQGRFLLPIGGEGAAPGQFYLPAGVTVDRHNRVFVADMFNRRVAIFQFLGGA